MKPPLKPACGPFQDGFSFRLRLASDPAGRIMLVKANPVAFNMGITTPAGMWGGYSLRNLFCYNSRLTAAQFSEILRHYCLGTPAMRAAELISKKAGKVTRQTVAKHYQQIGLVILRDRDIFRRFTWWPEELWPDGWSKSAITYKHLAYLREMLYAPKPAKTDRTAKEQANTEKRSPIDKLIYVRILRQMSHQMNGIPLSTFETHLGRACLLASFLGKGYANLKPQLAAEAEKAAKEEMFAFLQRYFLENPWLWSAKATKRRKNYSGRYFYEKETPLIEEDESTQWKVVGKKIMESESRVWEKKRLEAVFDDAVDLRDDPHTLIFSFRPVQKRKTKKQSKKKPK